MLAKKDLSKVADAVFRCGILSGSSAEEIISFAKKNAPTKDSEWISVLTAVAKKYD